MNLTPHFTYEEMITSETGVRRGIPNDPPPEYLANLKELCLKLEGVRVLLNEPMKVLSGYRSPTLNAAVGGAAHSAHMIGWACDFLCPTFGSPYLVCEHLSKNLSEFDQIIHEFGVWTHISFDPRMRKQLLTIKRDGKGYQEGILP